MLNVLRKMPGQFRYQGSQTGPSPTYAQFALICMALFLLSAGVRFFHWQNNADALMQRGMYEEYKAHAWPLYNGNLSQFLRGDNPPNDATFLRRTPGFPILMAVVYKFFGPSEAAVRGVNLVLDSLSALFVFFLAIELFRTAIAVIAGLLAALSPQLAYYSSIPLADPVAVGPILLALYFFIRAWKRPRLRTVAVAGALIGVSCWLRANALLLAPFLALLIPLLFERGRRLSLAAALVGATAIVIAPITIRNYLVFGRFIPLSLSTGLTLVEGIGVYDKEGRFGLPANDYELVKWEARVYNRPDYFSTPFGIDGIEREQARVAHAMAVIRANPTWFLGVVARRALDMLRLPRVELVEASPPITHSPDVTAIRPALTLDPATARASGTIAAQSAAQAASSGTEALRLEGEGGTTLYLSPPLPVRPHTDYLLRLPLKIETGSVIVDVEDARRNKVLATTAILHPVFLFWVEPPGERWPVVLAERPFVSGDAEEVRIRLRNGDRRLRHVTVNMERAELFELGPARYQWTRYPRSMVRLAQSAFVSAIVLPLAFIGLFLLMRNGRRGAAVILLAVPVYYLCVQSPLWTEFRYIMALHYFLLILASVTLYRIARALWQNWSRIKDRFARPLTTHASEA